MTIEDAIRIIKIVLAVVEDFEITVQGEEFTEEKCKEAVEMATKALDQEPSVQPEIIRCKDCKYWREHKYAKETKRYIPFCGFNAIYTKSDDFCSRAERREV